jgi:hypothetical protein
MSNTGVTEECGLRVFALYVPVSYFYTDAVPLIPKFEIFENVGRKNEQIGEFFDMFLAQILTLQ